MNMLASPIVVHAAALIVLAMLQLHHQYSGTSAGCFGSYSVRCYGLFC